jgi:hypothetical protein
MGTVVPTGTIVPKCMGMRGNNTQRAELRIENKNMDKIQDLVYLDICLQNTKEFGAKVINKLQNKWHG